MTDQDRPRVLIVPVRWLVDPERARFCEAPRCRGRRRRATHVVQIVGAVLRRLGYESDVLTWWCCSGCARRMATDLAAEASAGEPC